MTTTVGNLAHYVWHIAAIGLGLLLSVLATGHAVLNKRDPRAAIAWVGFVWFVPLVGAVMYFMFGVNRIRHKAALLRRNLERYRAQAAQPECLPEELQRHLPDHGGHLKILARVVGSVVERPLLPGNRIDPLVNGDEAYPAMLEAIHNARQTVSFVTYIFDRDEVGMAFAHALGEAARRGVEVRVLIDATGLGIPGPPFSPRCDVRGEACTVSPVVCFEAFDVDEHAHTPEDPGGGWARGIYRRHEYSSGTLPSTPTAKPGTGRSFPSAGPGGDPTAGGVHR
jgi:Phosphatidylserine/phosphatidylglycerophosphate/cardiolipin synthases and related enzymes